MKVKLRRKRKQSSRSQSSPNNLLPICLS